MHKYSVEPLPKIGPEHLVTGLKIGDVAIKEDVAGRCNCLVAKYEQETEGGMAVEAANPIYDVGSPF